MTTYTDTIGTGGDYGTLALWYAASASVPVSGDVLVAELLGGDHDFAGNYTGWNAVDFSINIKAHTSATHGGDWNTGAKLLLASGNSQSFWDWGDHSIDFIVEDVVISAVGNQFFRWQHIASSGVGGSYHSNITFNRCLMTAYNQSYDFFILNYLSLFDGPDTAPTALGTSKLTFNNCVTEADGTTSFVKRSAAGVTYPIARIETELVGCMLFKTGMEAGYNNTQSASKFSVCGCIYEPANVPNASRLTTSITNFSSVVVDYITGEYDSDLGSASFFNWGYQNGTPTNVTTNSISTVFPGFNYDNAITNGEVCFVGPSGPEGNYRLVADADNLAVKYVTNATLPTLDVSRYNRPGLTDAGAFQSISTDTVTNVVGSGAGADFATPALWYADRRTKVLNGGTEVAALQAQVHAYDGSYNNWDEVSFTACLRGQTHHNGNWDEGSRLRNAGSRLNYTWGNQSIDWIFEDLIYEQASSQGSYGSTWNHVVTNTDGSGFDSNLTFRRCLVADESPNNNNDFFRMTNNLSAVESIGTQNTTFENSVFALGNRVFSNEGRGSWGYDYNVYNRIVGTTIHTSHTSRFIIQRGVINGVTNSDVSGTLYYTASPVRTLVGGNVTFVDYISNETSHSYATSTVNSLAAQTFTFDNTVTNGAVCFVGSGYEGDYRLVADLDNLAVQYATNADLGGKDVARTHRTHDTDAGAFQSVSDRVFNYTIGSSNSVDYATWNLFRTAKGLELLNGDTYNLTYESGVYSPVDYIYYNSTDSSWNVVDTTFSISGQESHNGNWDEGVIFSATTAVYPQKSFWVRGNNQITNNNLTWNLKDIHFTNDPDNFAEYMIDTVWWCGRKVDHSYTFDRCLFSLQLPNKPIGRMNYFQNGFNYDLDSFGNIEDFGSFNLTLNNCVLESVVESGQVGGRGFDQNNGTYTGNYYLNVIGCSIKDIGDIGHARIGNPANGVSGDSVVFRAEGNLVNMTQPNAPSTYRQNMFYGYPTFSNFSGISIDNIFGNSSSIQNWITDDTNTTYDATFTYDGSVSAGTVAHVDSGDSVSALRDYRLVSDNDNLAVKYVRNASPLPRDVSDGPRSGLTDAGAFQSISDRVLSATIGYSTSAEAATFNLWTAIGTDGQALPDQDRWNRLVLHGDTIRMIYEPGTYSSTADNIYINRQSPDNTTYYNWLPVAVNWEIKGQKSHNGNWDEGAIFHLEGINDHPFARSDDTNRRDSVNGENWLFEDLVVINSDVAYIGLFDWSIRTDRAIDDSLTINRCLLRGRRNSNNSSPIRLNCIRGANDGSTGNFDKDSLGRKERIGSFTFNLTNSVVETRGRFIESNSGRYNGDHIYNYEGSYIRAGRMGADRMFSITYYAPTQGYYADDGGNVGMNVKGCIIDNVQGPDDSVFIDDFFPNYFTVSNATYRYINWSSTCVDNIFATPSSLNQVFSSTTNTLFDVSTTYDGTVTSGQVGFVDSGGVSAFRDYRLVADADNLAVEYMDLSSFSEQEDIEGRRRPGLTNPGAYQMYDDSVISATVGSGVDGVSAEYASLSLLKTTIANDILNGQTVEAVLQNQSHHIYIFIFGGNALKEVDQKWIIRNEDPQDGLWDNGARFTSDYNHSFFNGTVLRNAFTFELRDMVINNPTGSTYAARFGQAVSGSIHDTEFFVNRCLVNTNAPLHYAYPTLVSVKDGKYNTHTLKIFDSVITGPPSGSTRFLDDYYFSQGGGSVFASLGNSNIHIKGSTIFDKRIGRGSFTSQTSNNTIKVEGTLWGLWNPDITTIFYRNNLVDAFTIKDTLISNSSSTESGLTGDITNLGYDTDFYFDNQPHSDAVTFNSSSSDGESNFRLLADLDNLAVQHVEILNELPGRDITGYRKPRLSDAGAFQSISTSSTVHYVGTSSVTFTPDYTTLSLWRSDIYNDPILNGMTRTAVLADEVFEINAYFGGYYVEGPRRVHHSITLSGLSRQDGNLNTGTVFHISDSIYGNIRNNIYVESRSPTDITLNLNDIVVSSTYSLGNFSLCYMRAGIANFSQYTTNSNFGAYDLKSNFKNCIFISDASGSYLFTPVLHQTNLFVLDPNVDPSVAGRSDIIELGGVDTSYDNCVLIGPKNSYGRTDHNGNVGMLGIWIPNTTYGTSATLSMSSCTCVNTIFPLGRLPVVDNNFVGSMFYNDHTVLIANGWNNLLTNINVKEYQRLNFESIFGPTWRESISKFEDCIFSHASSYIAFRNSQPDLPIDASSFINCSFGKYFDFDGSARAGRVSFENNYVSSVSASYDFLDNFSGASIAYSLRKLSQSYAGYCIKVRRTSDNSEIDVGFDSNGDLNISAITNHCGAASGYVSVWYDQTSNSVDATQSTSANQPLIYDGTSIITENGKPALSFHESRDTRLTFDTDLFEGTYVDLFAVLAVDLDGIYGTTHLASEGGGTNLYWHTGGRREFVYPAYYFQVQGSSSDRFGITTQTERQCILELWSEPTKVRQRINNIQRNGSENRAPVAIPSGTRSYIIGARSGNYFQNMNGRYQEFIIFPEDQDTSRDAIFDNLNNHYEASPLYFTPRNQ